MTQHRKHKNAEKADVLALYCTCGHSRIIHQAIPNPKKEDVVRFGSCGAMTCRCKHYTSKKSLPATKKYHYYYIDATKKIALYGKRFIVEE